MEISGSLMVYYDFSHGKDASVVIISRVTNSGVIQIVNRYLGEEAEGVYNMLINRKDVKHV